MQYNDFLVSVLQKTTQIANSSFGNVIGKFKPHDVSQVLTQTDLDIGAYVIKEIEKTFPDYNIIDEEVGVIDKHSQFTWVIDPIDGTSNFAKAVPLYGTMIGLLKDDLPIAGGIAMPFFHEIYLAEKGKGAFCNNKKIYATNETNLQALLMAYGMDANHEHPEMTRWEGKFVSELALQTLNIRSAGSCFDVVMVAKGLYGGFMNQRCKIWDNIAQHILLEEAGCMYTDFFGKKMDYSNPLTKDKQNYTFCAAPKVIHQQLQKIIHENE